MPRLTKIHIARLRRQAVRNRLSRAIEFAGVTQQEMGDALGMKQSYISDVSRGRYDTLTVSNAHKFAMYLGVSIEDLFPFEPEKETDTLKGGSLEHH